MKILLKRLRLASTFQMAVISLLVPGLSLVPITGWSNPTGGVVKAGAAEINMDVAGHLKVFQQSDRAIINWETFSISAGEMTEFIQPSASAVALSRVISGNPSAIYGTLKANGGHILVNTSGILVGAGGVVDVGGLNVLSTLDIDDNNFMAGGDMRFVGSTSAGVTNFGTISSAGGDVILMGNFVDNQGSIGAINGTVALGAGGEILLHSSGDSKISILRGGVGGGTGVNNAGTITGASAELKAHGNVYALAVNNSGTIRATGASRVNGRVVLSATGDGSASGKIVNTGVIEANNRDGSGGTIMIDAGVAGEAEIGGTVRADGVGNKAGGSVTVLGDIINVTEGALVSASGGRGGAVTIGSPQSSSVNVAPTASIQATGTSGVAGTIMVAGQQVGLEGTLDATSEQADGGKIEVKGVDVSTTATSIINSSGFGSGGAINIRGTEDLSVGGRVISEGENGAGGRVILTAPNTVIRDGAQIGADGGRRGGAVNVGGGFQGKSASIPNATNTTVEAGATLSADSTGGNAGTVIVWADRDTTFDGDVRARALGPVGNGGMIEISGKETLTVNGSIEASSFGGKSGTVLFDPGNVLVSNTAGPGIIQNSTINNTLQSGTSVIIATESGNVTFLNSGVDNDRHDAIQWTNSNADFGVLASGSIIVQSIIRTSGAGSINMIAGWTGLEGDLAPGGLFSPGYVNPSTGEFNAGAGALDPEGIWEHYVENGQFGNGIGSILIGDAGLNRHYVVGSRYGNTNLAGNSLVLTTVQLPVDTGESDYAHIGFRDGGAVLSLSGGAATHVGTGVTTNTAFDMNALALMIDNDPAVGFLDFDDYENYMAARQTALANGLNPGDAGFPVIPSYMADINNDTVPDGVYAVNSSGILDSTNTSTAGNPTFISFSNHYTSAVQGNWWWQQIDARNPDPLGFGGRTPEQGAGLSETNRADINIALTGGVLMKSGGRHQDYAQIGHGGNSSQWGVDKSLRDANLANNFGGQVFRLFSWNGASNDRGSSSIGRLAPVYGNINILTGVDRNTVEYDRTNQKVNLTGTTNSSAGLIRLEAWQNTASSNGIANPETGNNSESSVHIGHLGVGQFGNVVGDINIKAGGDVELLAGAHTRNFAAIGHQIGGFVYWNPHSDRSTQVRFFANAQDFDNPNLRKGELFAQTDGSDARGFYPADFRPATAGQANGRWDADFWDVDGNLLDGINAPGVAQTGRDGFHALGPMHIAAFSGAVDKTLVGDITVESYGNNGVRVVGFSTPDTQVLDVDRTGDGVYNSSDVDATLGFDGLRFVRDSRYAMIGHGGRGFSIGSEDGDDRVVLRYQPVNGGDNDLSTSLDTRLLIAGVEGGTGVNRSPTFMNMIGDITVNANNGGVEISAGNDAYDFAAIGHGGAELTDMETGNVAIGDITVTGAKNLVMRGASAEGVAGFADLPVFTGDLDGARVQRAQAQIGHHGYEARTNYYSGDITVQFDGDITLAGGRYRDSGAKIGHQTAEANGQTGGTFVRNEQFLYGPHFMVIPTSAFFSPINADATVTDTEATITIGSQVNTYDISGNTANITVEAGGDLTMQHSTPGLALNQNQARRNSLNGRNDLNDLRFVEVLIGHGARRTGLRSNTSTNDQYNSKDKMGNITVSAENITMTNGSGLNWFTTIGHMFGTGDRFDAANLSIDRAGVLAGNISVTARGNLLMDGSNTPGNDPNNLLPLSPTGAPARSNFIRIGHGGVLDNLDINVASDGQVIHGIAASSNINVNVGNDMTLNGGNSELGGYTQVGHGFSSDIGNDRSRPAGFSGNITVNVENDLTLTAGSLAWLESGGGNVVQVRNAAAVIGHGGDMLEDELKGDITVTVGNDLNMTAAQRTQGPARDAAGNPASSLYGFTKIGHWSTSYQLLPTFQPVASNQSGDISVTVGNDMNLKGGTTTAANLATDGGFVGITNGLIVGPTLLGYTQIGHSGPGVSGFKNGDIDIRVGNDLTTTRGTVDPVGVSPNFNSVVMIGNGDWLPDGNQLVVPTTGGTGTRSGDISVSAGNNAFFDRTLVGHYDPRLLPAVLTSTSGTTTIGVSRNMPFYGGTGTLDALDSVFTSALGGSEELRFYLPARTNNLMNLGDNNRFNSATTTYRGVGGTAGANFTDGTHATLGQTWDPTRNGGAYAGDLDEIYLQPDLWWNRTALSTSVGTAADFSTGSVATVDSPGGLPNLVALAAGELGSGTADYRGTGTALYTIYYDAIAPVSLLPPTSSGGGGGGIFVPVPEIPEPVVVPLPFDFLPFIWWDKFDSYDRETLMLLGAKDNYLSGIGLVARLLGDVEGEPGVGRAYDSEAIESLAEILGFPVDETDEEEEDDEREENASAYQKLGSLYGIYWQYQAFGGAGHYSSNNQFGTPGL